MISYQGNYYSVPDATQGRRVEIQILPLQLFILSNHQKIAHHTLQQPGQGLRVLDPTHRKRKSSKPISEQDCNAPVVDTLYQPLELYQAIGECLSQAQEHSS